MRTNSRLLTLLAVLLLLNACSSDEKQEQKVEAKEPTILKHQLKALDDAKKIQAEANIKAEERNKKIKEQIGKADD